MSFTTASGATLRYPEAAPAPDGGEWAGAGRLSRLADRFAPCPPPSTQPPSATPAAVSRPASAWSPRSGADGPSGMTANAVTSLSLEPPLMIVCFAHTARTLAAVQHSGRFGVHFLAHDQEDVAARFASKMPEPEKFEGLDWTERAGVPALDGCLAGLACELRELLPGRRPPDRRGRGRRACGRGRATRSSSTAATTGRCRSARTRRRRWTRRWRARRRSSRSGAGAWVARCRTRADAPRTAAADLRGAQRERDDQQAGDGHDPHLAAHDPQRDRALLAGGQRLELDVLRQLALGGAGPHALREQVHEQRRGPVHVVDRVHRPRGRRPAAARRAAPARPPTPGPRAARTRTTPTPGSSPTPRAPHRPATRLSTITATPTTRWTSAKGREAAPAAEIAT